MTFGSLEEIVVSAAEVVRPPERMTVSQTAERYRRLNNRGAYVGPWKNQMAPYLMEPMDLLTSLRYTGLIFVAPAQSGKTESFLNWYTHTVIVDPADMMLIEVSNARARDFSVRRVDRLHTDSPAVGERLIKRRNHDNTFDKRFQSGALITLSWPTVNELSGKPIPRVFLTDYDRMDQDIGGDGAPFDLARARTTTFAHYGMTVAESSPSFPITDPRWAPSTPFEAPPTQGILGLYNRGDRRRWHWVCVRCDQAFEPDFTLMRWPEELEVMEAAEAAWLECPFCSTRYYEIPGENPGRYHMNIAGLWLAEGQRRTKEGKIVGKPVRSQIASFWLKGPAAAFKDWTTLVFNYLNAKRRYDQTGIEEDLKTTTNVDQALPYLPKYLESERMPEVLKDRAFDFGDREVPEGVRFLVASIDVQKSRFVVQVHGISRGGDLWVVDRFDIRYSLTPDPDRQDQFLRVRPHAETQDWRLLLREVILRDYPLIDGSGRRMSIKAVVCDSGGLGDVTSNAYAFWRWLRHGPNERDRDYEEWRPEWQPGLHARFALYRGNVNTDSRTRISFPDSTRKDRHAGARGEIPQLLCNSDMLKDQVNSILDRDNEGTGKVHFPSWLGISFFKELCVETKDEKGRWVNPQSARNESWDLFVMALAVLIEPRYVGFERIDWENPPEWAAEWDLNSLVHREGTASALVASKPEGQYSREELGRLLG